MADPAEPLARTELGPGVAQSTNMTANERSSTPYLDAPTIPGYRITRILGEGGMGTVYGAEQDAPRRQVAIKVLQGRSGSALARFKAEAEIMARLDHVGIARVLEAGESEGHPFLVMDHVAGTTLDIFTKGLDVGRKLDLFGALCEAVQHAHLKGVIHRDLKPSNVMVRSDDHRVVVLDFGIARLAADDDKTPSSTRAGELIGTPLYMSPEQAMLRADQVDVRTDVYTLGVMLYELVCGALPYETRDAPLPILTCMICEVPPIALSKRDPQWRGDLDAITQQALAKDPAKRYQSVAALADDVQRFCDGVPVSVRTPTSLERARAFVRRRPVLAATIAGSALALAVFVAIVTVLWRDASHARGAAESARVRTEIARAELESRSNQLVLRQARAALGRDPTEALAWLATLTPRDVDTGTAWAIVHEAIARGVAKDVLKGHIDEVHWIEPLPGAGFVSAGYDGRVIVWDPGQRVIYAAKGRAHLARPAPAGQQIAIGGDDGDLRVVDHKGTLLAQLAGHVGDVQHLAWSRDGVWLASGDDHGNVFLWPKGGTPGTLIAHGTSAIGDVAFSADGSTLVAGDHDGHVAQWDIATGTELDVVVPKDVVQTWTDGAHAAAVDGNGSVHWWKRVGSTLVVDHVTPTGLNCKRAVFAADGTWAVLGGVGGVVTRVIGNKVEPLAHFHAQSRTVAISNDGRWVASGADDGELEARDLMTGQVIALHGHTGRIRHVAFAGSALLSGDSDGIVRRWELAAIPPTVLDTRGDPTERMVVAHDGSMLAWVDTSGQVGAWTFADHRYTQLGHVDGRPTAVAIVDGTVVTGTAEGVVTWWLAQPVRQELHAIIKQMAAGHDLVAVASSLGPIAMFSAAGTPRRALAGHPNGSDAVAIDPGSTLVVSGGQDRVIRVWRVADGAQLAALEGPVGDADFAIVTAERIVVGSNGGTVLAWPRNGDQIDAKARVLVMQHTGAVTALAMSSTAIVSAGRNATLARAAIVGGAIRPAEVATIPNAAIAVAIDDHDIVRAVTRNSAAIRWSPNQAPAVEIDHGVRDGAGSPSGRWIESFDDGTFVIADQGIHSFADLNSAIRAATTYKLKN